MKLSGNKILITGGGSGIGLALAERFIKEGNTVIICGRRKSALKEASDKLPGLITIQCDLSGNKGREELFAHIKKVHGDVNVLINNAGIQNWMHISDPEFNKKAEDEININVKAPVHLTNLFLELGSLNTVMNVSSGLSFVPLIKTPVYCATKAFLHSFTVSLRALLKEKDIEVIEIIPPALNTDLGGKGIHDFAPPVSGFIESIFEQLKEGKEELTYNFTDVVSKAGQDVLKSAFDQINQVKN